MAISVPRPAASGEIITERSVITYPSETGLKLDADNACLPLRIIQRLVCRLDGAVGINVTLERRWPPPPISPSR